jgi:hypothetical protein
MPELPAAVVVDVNVGRGCDLLKTLLAPLPAALDVHSGILDGGIRRRFPAIAWGWVMLGRLVTGGMLGGDTSQLLGGVPDGAGHCLRGYH